LSTAVLEKLCVSTRSQNTLRLSTSTERLPEEVERTSIYLAGARAFVVSCLMSVQGNL
jgi:hypothetical protein